LLHYLIIQHRPDLYFFRRWKLVSRQNEWAHGRGPIEPFAGEPIEKLVVIAATAFFHGAVQASLRNVIHYRIAEYRIEAFSRISLLEAPADDHGKFGLILERDVPICEWNGVRTPDDRGAWFGEKLRRQIAWRQRRKS